MTMRWTDDLNYNLTMSHWHDTQKSQRNTVTERRRSSEVL